MLEIKVSLHRERFDLEAELTLNARVNGIFGPSGSGKSTLLNIVAGLIKPQSGLLKLDGEILFDSEKKIWLKPHQRRIGVVFQDSQLFPHLTIRQNLLYGFNRTPADQRQFQLKAIVDLLEIGHLLDSRPHQLSGGEKQRVGLGRALLASPRLLLLDEPLASLDIGLKQQILPFLKRIKDELNLPLLYVSHAIEEILLLTDQVVFVERGRILGHGHFLEIIKQSNILGMTRNLGLENIITVDILDHDLAAGYSLATTHGQKIILPPSNLKPGTQTSVTIKSGEIALAKSLVPDISIQNQIIGRIANITRAADRIMLQVDTGDILIIDVTINAFNKLKLSVGDEVYCLLKAQSFHYLDGSAVLSHPTHSN